MAQRGVLSRREEEVLLHLLEGKSNKMIAAALHITERTVEFHLNNIYAKHGVGSRMELARKLGFSTVAGGDQVPENEDTLNPGSWVASFRQAASRAGKEFQMSDVFSASERPADEPVTFFDAVRVCLAKYADFEGRAQRPEFWWFALFVTLLASALTAVHEAAGSVFLIAVLLPFLAAGARRLRDTNRSPWWLLFLLVPVGGLVLLGFIWAEPSSGGEPAVG